MSEEQKEEPPQTVFAEALRRAMEQKFFFVGYADKEYHGQFHIFTTEKGVTPEESFGALVEIATNILRVHAPQTLQEQKEITL